MSKKIIVLALTLILFCSCACASDGTKELPFGLKSGDSFEHVCEVMANIFGEGEPSESFFSKSKKFNTEQINILGLRLFSAEADCLIHAESEEKITIRLSLEAGDLVKEQDYGKLFNFYESLCSIMGNPESSSHIVTTVDLSGNVTKESILKRPEEFKKEASKSEVEITETWSNADLSISMRSFTNSCYIHLNINVTK